MSEERKRWLDEPRNVKRLFVGLAVACGLLIAAEPFVHRHAIFEWEGWFGFHAIFGFVAYSALVLSATQLRKLLKRREDYYD